MGYTVDPSAITQQSLGEEETMPKKVKPIPNGYHTATPYLIVDDGARAIEFYERAFGA